jgi:hypothetical protein
MIGLKSFFAVNDRQMIANLKSVSPLYSKNYIIKVLFDYFKYLYKNKKEENFKK